MAETIRNVGLANYAGGVGPLQSLAAATSAGEGTRYNLPAPMSQWGLQVVAPSCNVSVALQLGCAASSGSWLTTVLTWAASSGGGGTVSGNTVFSTAPFPASVCAANLLTNASSGGCWAFIVGVP